MPRPKKDKREMTTEEAARWLFSKRVVDKAKKEAEKPQVTPSKRSIKE